MCLIFLLALFAPRLALAFWWVFGDRVEFVFNTWFWPLLGLIFAPWTTIMYLLTWSPGAGVSGADWILVGVGAAVDVMSWSARAAKNRLGY